MHIITVGHKTKSNDHMRVFKKMTNHQQYSLVSKSAQKHCYNELIFQYRYLAIFIALINHQVVALKQFVTLMAKFISTTELHT